MDAAGAAAVRRGMSLGMNNVLRCGADFRVQECVRVTDADGFELARGGGVQLETVCNPC